MSVWVFGAKGQLGTDLVPALRAAGYECYLVGREVVDLMDPNAVTLVKERFPAPQWIVNCAAATNTGKCETQTSQAFRLNAGLVLDLAKLANEVKARFIQVSTDYVFDGEATSPYNEDDATRPINMYGVSKLAGELVLQYTCPEHYILRSSSLYGVAGAGAKGGNFVESMIDNAKKGGPISIVNDQWMSPTHTDDLAHAIVALMNNGEIPFGIYHYANAGHCSWHEFGVEIFKQLKLAPKVTPVSASAFPSALKRPAYSVLGTKKIKQWMPLRPWQEALTQYLHKKGHLK